MNKVFSKWAKHFDPNHKPQAFHAFCNKCQKLVYEMKVVSGQVICSTCREVIGDSKSMHYQLKDMEDKPVITKEKL